VSNLTLGSGIQPAAKLLRAGVNVALGSDGSSSTTADIFEQAKFASLLSRISQTDCDQWLMAPQAMTMATTNGAGVLDERGKLGVIKPGAHADLAILDLDHPVFRPCGDLWNHLVLYAAGSAVDTVLVGGDVVVRKGRCVTVNEDDLMAEADALARQDETANQASFAEVRAERPAFQKLILEALARPAPVDRFAHLT
jgi:cytosine/adenosine deaminase-related metal-dependent hydrolase